MITHEMLKQNPQQAADEIAADIRAQDGSLAPAYAAIEAMLEHVRASGLPVESLLPEEARLGFLGRKHKDG
jgi:hypothetical protein